MALTNKNKLYAPLSSLFNTHQYLITVLFFNFTRLHFAEKQIYIKYVLLFVLAIFFVPNSAHSEIWIEEIQQAELPLALLSSSKKKIILKQNNSLGASTTATIVGGQHYAGQYRINSDTSSTITINLTSNNNINHVLLKKFKLKYNGTVYNTFPVSGLINPGQSGKIIKVGFTTIITSGAPEGISQPSFTIDATEDQP